MAQYEKLLNDVFGYKPKNIPPAIKEQLKIEAGEPLPEPKKTRNNAVRDVGLDTMANVQGIVWGNGNIPPAKAPPAKAIDKGMAPQMGNQEGWGKI